jgi:uncharacterized membrane protein required for colicin V production
MDIKLPVNVFDIILIAVIAAGIMRGRKHGMSGELMQLIKWASIVVVCGLAYEPLGKLLSETSPFSLLTSYLMAYVGVALVILGIFVLIQRHLGEKLVGSDVFGRAEYYLGMGSGILRFACMLLAALALLNARYFSQAEVQSMKNYQDEVYGSNFFPTLQTAQATVFQTSMSGPWIREHLALLLIRPTSPNNADLHQGEYHLPE